MNIGANKKKECSISGWVFASVVLAVPSIAPPFVALITHSAGWTAFTWLAMIALYGTLIASVGSRR